MSHEIVSSFVCSLTFVRLADSKDKWISLQEADQKHYTPRIRVPQLNPIVHHLRYPTSEEVQADGVCSNAVDLAPHVQLRTQAIIEAT